MGHTLFKCKNISKNSMWHILSIFYVNLNFKQILFKNGGMSLVTFGVIFYRSLNWVIDISFFLLFFKLKNLLFIFLFITLLGCSFILFNEYFSLFQWEKKWNPTFNNWVSNTTFSPHKLFTFFLNEMVQTWLFVWWNVWIHVCAISMYEL